MRWGLVVVLCSAACHRAIPITATVTPARPGVVKVDVKTEPGMEVTLHTTPSMKRTAQSDGHVEFELVTSTYPIGSVSIDVDATDPKKASRHGEGKATFNRARIEAVAHVILDPPIIQGGCYGAACRHYFGKDVGASRVFFEAPLGTSVEIGGTTTRLAAVGTPVTVDLATPFAALAANLVVDKPEGQARMPPMTVPMKITSPDGDRADGEATFDVETTLADFRKALDAADKTGVALSGDAPAPARLRVIYDAASKKTYGKGSIGEIDAVAFHVPSQHSVGSCGLYQSDSGKTVAISNYAMDADVVVRDRQTTKEIARKRFYGTASSCPDTAHMFGGSTSLTGRGPDDQLMAEWIASLAHGTHEIADGSLRKLSPRAE